MQDLSNIGIKIAVSNRLSIPQSDCDNDITDKQDFNNKKSC